MTKDVRIKKFRDVNKDLTWFSFHSAFNSGSKFLLSSLFLKKTMSEKTFSRAGMPSLETLPARFLMSHCSELQPFPEPTAVSNIIPIQTASSSISWEMNALIKNRELPRISLYLPLYYFIVFPSCNFFLAYWNSLIYLINIYWVTVGQAPVLDSMVTIINKAYKSFPS